MHALILNQIFYSQLESSSYPDAAPVDGCESRRAVCTSEGG